jgi:signal transduction histidine kinase/ligand-binding sensor domain-containing protein
MPEHSSAGSERYAVDVWQVEEGLPDNRVTAIAQTPDGYMWFGTYNGVVRFDGVRFTVFDARTPGLQSGRIASLFSDSAGGLWIGMEYGELAHYAAGKFTTFGPAQGWHKIMVVCFAEPRPGEIFLGTKVGGVLRFNGERFVPLLGDATEEARKAAQLNGHMNLAVNTKDDSLLWARTAQGLKFFRSGQWTSYSFPDRTPPIEIMAVARARRGGLLVSATGRLLLLQNDESPALRGELPDRSRAGISGMVEDSSGSVWLTSWGQGLFRIAPDGVSQKFSGPEGVPDFLLCVFEDREGNIWAGSNGRGLIRLKHRVFTSYAPEAPLPSYRCTVLAENPTGGLWVGTDGRGLVEWKENKFSAPIRLADLPPERPIWALVTEASGRLWIGSYAHGAFVKDDEKSVCYDTRNGLLNNRVMALAVTRDGAVWIGAATTLSRYADGTFEKFDQDNGLPRNAVRAITEDASGDLWIGTEGGGLARWRKGRFEVFTRAHGLLHNSIRCLHADADGSLWIGSQGGLSRRRNNHFEHLRSENGLPDVYVISILDDGIGYLWLGLNRGVFRVARAQLDALGRGELTRVEGTHYLKGDGLASIQCSEGSRAAIRTRDGRLWFATTKGISVVDPRELRTNSVAPAVQIEEVLVDGEAQTTGGGEAAVSVPAGRRRLEIRYTALSFTAPERVRFKQRLDGFDEAWRDVGDQRATSFQGLRPGNYRFRVIAANNDGVWNNEGASLAFVVQPEVWRTAWFRAGVLVALAGVGFGLYRARIGRLQREQAIQREFSRGLIESQEQERKRIAGELHDSLEQNLLVIKNRALLALGQGDPPPSLKESLEQISSVSSSSIEEVRTIAGNLRPHQLDRLGLARALTAMLRDTAESSGLRLTSDIAEVKGRLTKEAEINLYRIVQESLNNIIKHAGATEASVTLQIEGDRLRLRIRDNGRGFDARTALGVSEGLGFGLTGMVERAKLLGGQLKFTSEPGRGTEVEAQIPISPHLKIEIKNQNTGRG